jgi:pilus assembly protein CpaF
MNATNLHQTLIDRINNENVIDLSTLPSGPEQLGIQTRVEQLLAKDFAQIEKPVRDRVFDEFFKCGPLEPLLVDPAITEIVVNGQNEIWYEKQGLMQAHDDRFLSSISYQNFLQRLANDSRIQANLERPYADGYWRQYRVHLIIPPLAQAGAHLSLRRHPDNPWTFSRLAEAGWASADALHHLRKMVKEHVSFLVVGGTGTGKTSVLNACLAESDPHERIVAIEDTSEIQLPNRLSVKLLARFDAQGILPQVSQAELLRQALRMRPDRVVMGEVRGDEAKDLLMALSTGHRGGLGTLHADSPHQALYRLEMLIQMGAPQWSLQAIRHLIYFGLQAIVCVKREGGQRRLVSIHRIASLEDTGFCLDKVF